MQDLEDIDLGLFVAAQHICQFSPPSVFNSHVSAHF